ncbi:MAG: hypothetical protein ACKO34_02385 [Vampirovibrionales bacterium]
MLALQPRLGNIYGLATFNKATGEMDTPKTPQKTTLQAANVLAPELPVVTFEDLEHKPMLATGKERDLLLATQAMMNTALTVDDAFIQAAARRAYEDVLTATSVNANFVDVRHIEENPDQFKPHANVQPLKPQTIEVSTASSGTSKATASQEAKTKPRTEDASPLTILPPSEKETKETKEAKDVQGTKAEKETKETAKDPHFSHPHPHKPQPYTPPYTPKGSPQWILIENSQLIFNSPNTSIAGNTQTGSHSLVSADSLDASSGGDSPAKRLPCSDDATTEITVLVGADALKDDLNKNTAPKLNAVPAEKPIDSSSSIKAADTAKTEPKPLSITA